MMLAEATPITADAEGRAAVVLRTKLQLGAIDLAEATLQATAHGVYEVRIDGVPISEAVLAPGWTAYEWRLQVQEYDVTSLVKPDSLIEVTLGNGWWRGGLGWEGADGKYGDDLALLATLTVRDRAGRVHLAHTDTTWEAIDSPTSMNSLYHGQRIDARIRDAVPAPRPVRVAEIDRSTLVPQVGPMTVRHAVVEPKRIWSSPSGRTLVDFGQNLVGWVRLRARGARGDEIVLRHAEVLENGELGVRPLRSARATDTFVLSGGVDEFEPTFTFHGFRFLEVTGFPGELTAEALEAVVVYSDLDRTGWFECSDARVNQLVSNSVWSQMGNFLDVPTDCPQRDERLGWTGDIAAYASTAAFQFDVADFLHKWLLDLEVETRAAGPQGVPDVVPDILRVIGAANGGPFSEPRLPKAVWGDAAVWVPQALWHAYGDRDRLAAHYPAMALHLASVEGVLDSEGLWAAGFQYGDWLDPDAPPEDAARAKADPAVVATACLVRSASFAAEAARVLGMDADADRWQDLADRTRRAFVAAYVGADGRIRSDCATVYALAIVFDVVGGALRTRAGERLAELVREGGYRVTTGFAGTPYITDALTETGHVDEAYRLLLEDGCPSWLYPVTMGATTIWERWDSMLPDGSINPGEMTSFNHYALGAVADWLYRVVAGIRPAAPGYARLRLQPVPGAGLSWARASLETRHGRVTSGWRREPDGIVVEVEVPHGIEADVVLPDGSVSTVTGGRHSFVSPGA
ncbi:family 78 glycoside hydrolase catalytic domain [Microbacterium arborescens]